MANSLEAGANQVDQNLANNATSNEEIYRGTEVLGTRGALLGGPTQAGMRQSRGTQNIIRYLERSREFNTLPRSGSQLNGITTAAGGEEARLFNAEAEVTRVRLAADVLRKEAERRKRNKCCGKK